ncbi:vitamin K epoxide reductase family protein [Nitzschia inconspicua]|uniref:Vitamin K epoxide reductase family protein n=1 Tax=Nitzschia inconspicua TaxID=303405 RepID=A0A9K3LAH7_9STRA|nr:vitamin K epoxide reductase family protein [Nitzschia inconspicua]
MTRIRCGGESMVMLCFLLILERYCHGFLPPLSSRQHQNNLLRDSESLVLFRWHSTTHSFLKLSNDDGPPEIIRQDVTSSSTISSSIWMPQLRRIMAGIASLGVIETGYLTYTKLFTDTHLPAFCSSSSVGATPSACESVLTGPYSNVPFTDIPLASLGLVAYSLVVYLSLSPLQQPTVGETSNDDTQNRILLGALTTAMGTFSIFLMTILFGVLHAPCPYCIFSAACSITLAQMAWIGGCLPENQSSTDMGKTKSTVSVAVPSSILVGIVAAAVLYFGSTPMTNSGSTLLASSSSFGTTTTTLAATPGETKLYSPPEITTVSSQRALKLAQSLQSLDAKMYGAYWCSHCYDQKQILGKQAFESYVDYVECSKDGINSQTKLCKSKEVPGYPTWEIHGKLYPGQQELDELEELVQGLLEK